jgi:SET domain-containing protein
VSRSLSKDFEANFGVRYLPQLEYADWRVERHIKKLCAYALKKDRVGQLALWLGKLHAKELAEGRIPDIEIEWISEEMGYGAFTNRPIKKWEFVGEYTGIVRRRRWVFPNLNDYCFMYPREWISHRLYTIDSEKEGNFTRFINHSDTPNLESVAVFKDGVFHILFRAVEDILPGKELVYDYGPVYWNKRKKVIPLPLCKSP